MSMLWLMAVLPVAMLVVGFPFFLVLLGTSAVVLVASGTVPPAALHQVMFSSIDKFALLAVPFFIFAGDLMARGGVSRRLVRWVTSLVGGVRGGLPFTALGTTTVFSAVSGSTAATVAAVGGLTYQPLRSAGYSEKFSAGLLASSAAMGNLIPPSIGFILYGIAAEASIVKLFAAGILPGIIFAGFFALTIAWYVRRSGEGRGRPFSMREFLMATKDGLWAIAAPVIVLGGIYTGVFSPTEAAGVACAYALLVVGIIYREIGWKEILESASRSMYLTAQVFVIVAAAGVFSWLLTVNGVPQALVKNVVALELSPWAVLVAINAFLLGVGMVLDTTSAVLVLTPLLAPVAAAMGVDPIHFGVIMVMNLSIGTFTPPFGLNLFVGQAIFKTPVTVLYQGVLPFLPASLAALAVVSFFPSVSLLIPRWI